MGIVTHAEKYGRLLLVKKRVGTTTDGHILSAWLCDCGTKARVAYSRVKCGTTVSCGCYALERLLASRTTHGGRYTPEYSSWQAMKRRCLNPDDKDYPRYGGKGVTICRLWQRSFMAFLAHIGKRPDGTTLDRIKTTQGYKPGNVRWATSIEQGRNRRGTRQWKIKGRPFESIGEAAKAFSVSEFTIWRWTYGAFDSRRGTFTKPRSDCSAKERYASHD